VVVAVEDGGVTSGVVVAGAGAGVAEGAVFTGGAAAAGGGVAVDGAAGVVPTVPWVGATGTTGATAPVLTPLVVALGALTERSGEATVVEWLRVTIGAVARVVTLRWVVVVVVLVGVAAAAVAESAVGGVTARLAPPAGAVLAASEVVLVLAVVVPPGVRVWSAGRVAYQPATASAARATRPTPIAAGATDPLRRTVVVRVVTNGASSPFGLMAVWRAASSVIAPPARPPVAPPTAAPVTAASAAGLSWNIERRVARPFFPRSQIGVGANIEESESCGASPSVVRV